MNILSIKFYFELAVILFIYWIIPSKYRWMLLSAVSWYVIIHANSKKMAVVALLMYLSTWFFGLMHERLQSNQQKRICVTVSLIIDAGLLVLLKDSHFFVVLGKHAGFDFPELTWGAPLGISYFGLSLIGYALDVYWDVIKPETNFFKFALFGGYFPLLLTGPIVKYQDTSIELFSEKKFDSGIFSDGCERILWGLFKKMVVSNRIGILVDAIYNDTWTYRGPYIWFAMLCFTLQLYTDFSGSIDIILGISQLFGIKLPENFDLPFASKNLSEFWRRWHITLGLWLKDYILYPLLKSPFLQNVGIYTKKKFGKRIGKKIPTWMGLFVSWFVVGFWHGGAWNYIIGVGWYMWFIIVLSDALSPFFTRMTKFFQVNTNCLSWKIFQWLRTTIIFAVGLGMFRCYGGFHEVLHVYRAGFRLNNFMPILTIMQNVGMSSRDITMLTLGTIIIALSGIIKLATNKGAYEWIQSQNYPLRILVNWCFVTMIIFSSNLNMKEFLYMAF